MGESPESVSQMSSPPSVVAEGRLWAGMTALFLALTLTAPNPAFALRESQEDKAVLQLAAALGGPPTAPTMKDAVVSPQPVPGTPGTGSPTAGLEELPESVHELFQELIPRGYNPGLTKRAENLLASDGIVDTDELLSMSKEGVEEIRNVGPRIMEIIDLALKPYGWRLLSQAEIQRGVQPQVSGIRIADLNFTDRALRALKRRPLEIHPEDPVEKLTEKSVDDFIEVRGVGRWSVAEINEIREKLGARGLSLRGEVPQRAEPEGPPVELAAQGGEVTADARRQAVERVRAEFAKLSASTAVVGIGPSESSRYAEALRVIGQLLDEPTRRRLFVVTRTAAQGLYLKSLGLAASDQPVDLVDQLKSRFKNGSLQADYLTGDPAALEVLQDAILLMGADIRLIARPIEAQAKLRDFLQELLAGLSPTLPETVSSRFDLDQLASDIDLLIRA